MGVSDASKWKARQDPRLLAAIARAFCEHKGQPPSHTCTTAEDRKIIAAWVRHKVMSSENLKDLP